MKVGGHARTVGNTEKYQRRTTRRNDKEWGGRALLELLDTSNDP